ncbi:response regulator transcription factor [Gryllotalpicola protaetiae]|uniref:response regulator transcription factor n=1 Tax=Gryllotalpicola protaetiae TaxID=2419771 RepID=UPI001FE99CD4|nr:response regulator transcription factor [Gryllotalpicola protaetiae]
MLVAEDQTFVREGILRVLEHAGMKVEAVGDADALRRRAAQSRPDVLVTDIRMPPNMSDDGIDAARELRTEFPDLGVVVLSQYLDTGYAMKLVADRPQGVGYLLKEKVAQGGVLADAVRRVAAGESALDPDVVSLLIGRRREPGELDMLTSRERDVLALMAEGRSNAGIAAMLHISVGAVERYATRIFSKLGLQEIDAGQHRRVLAVLKFLRH